MENNIYEILSENLIKLRKSKDLTQAELADILKFSDKSVSKWETGMSYPSIDTLAQIAEFYKISLDELCLKRIEDEKIDRINISYNTKRFFIALLSVFVIFLIATVVFASSVMASVQSPYWQAFIWAVPISTLILMILEGKWRGSKYMFIYTSVFTWTLITSIYCTLIDKNLFLLFIVGVPIQIIILLVKSVRSETFINKVDNLVKRSSNKHNQSNKEKSK